MDYKAFWSNFIQVLSKKTDYFLLEYKPPSNGWFGKQSRIESIISYYFNISEKEKEASINVLIQDLVSPKEERKTKNLELFKKIFAFKDEIEFHFSEPLIWEDNEGNDKARSKISFKQRDIDCSNIDNFELVTDFLIPNMLKLIQIFDRYFSIINIVDSNSIDEIEKCEKIALENGIDTESIYALQLVRGAVQRVFREKLLKAYDCSCAVCGLSMEPALDAAHIISYKVQETRLKIQNGILLCSVHHKLYDRDLLKISQDYTIGFSQEFLDSRVITEYDKLMTTIFNQRKIRLPKDTSLHPSPKYLALHKELDDK